MCKGGAALIKIKARKMPNDGALLARTYLQLLKTFLSETRRIKTDIKIFKTESDLNKRNI